MEAKGTEWTYVLGVLFASLGVFDYPPQMTCKVHRTALVGFFEQFASVQRGLGDQGVVILLGETPGSVERSGDDAHSLELCARVTDGVLVNGECLGKELVAEFFKSRLIGHFAAHHKQAQCQVGAPRVGALIEIVYALVHEPIKGGGL